jgi:hypothetical protein
LLHGLRGAPELSDGCFGLSNQRAWIAAMIVSNHDRSGNASA